MWIIQQCTVCFWWQSHSEYYYYILIVRDTIWYRYSVDLVIRQVPVTHINHVKDFCLFAYVTAWLVKWIMCSECWVNIQKVIRYLVILEHFFFLFYFESILHHKCPRYIVKGFLASSHSNAIRMYVIVTWML